MERIKDLKSRIYTNGDHFTFETKDFSWLLEKLTGQSDNRYYGCELNIPETVLFKDGKPLKIIRTESNGFVTTIKSAISLPELKKYLINAGYKRNKELIEEHNRIKQIRVEEEKKLKKERV